MNRILKFTEDYPFTTGVIVGVILGLPLLFGLWAFFLIELAVIIAADLTYAWRQHVAARRAALVEELRAQFRNPLRTAPPVHDVEWTENAQGPQGAQGPVSDEE